MKQPPSNTPILFYDGICNLCTKIVQFVIRRDSRKQFRFASLQSLIADRYLEGTSEDQKRLESMILIVGNRIYSQSTAVLLTAKKLDGFWPLLAVFLLIPRSIRDKIYQLLAKHRYQVLGKEDRCWKPAQDLADRFLDT